MRSDRTHVEFSNVAYYVHNQFYGILISRAARTHGERQAVCASYDVGTVMNVWG